MRKIEVEERSEKASEESGESVPQVRIDGASALGKRQEDSSTRTYSPRNEAEHRTRSASLTGTGRILT